MKRRPRHKILKPKDQDKLDYSYGVECSWHGPANRLKVDPSGKCGCPHCGKKVVLISENDFWVSATLNENAGCLNYYDYLVWIQGKKCRPSVRDFDQEFEEEFKKNVTFDKI